MTLPLELVRGTSTEVLGETVFGETRNVSSTGVFFHTGEKVRVGEQIEYFITLPKATGAKGVVRIRCLGTVVREQPQDSAFAATLERYEFLRES